MFRTGEWDSQHFGIKISKIYPTNKIPTNEDVGHVVWDSKLIIANTENILLVPKLESMGFKFITAKVIIEYKSPPKRVMKRDVNVELIRKEDIDACAKLVSESLTPQSPFTSTGIIFDKKDIFTEEKIKELYDGWFRRTIDLSNSISICYYKGDKPVGVICSEFTNHTAINELFAVDPSCRGEGIGTALGRELFNFLGPNDIFYGVVNIHNLIPLRLWESLGAHIHSVQYVLHAWY